MIFCCEIVNGNVPKTPGTFPIDYFFSIFDLNQP